MTSEKNISPITLLKEYYQHVFAMSDRRLLQLVPQGSIVTCAVAKIFTGLRRVSDSDYDEHRKIIKRVLGENYLKSFK